MHTVCETFAFLASADDAGLTRDDIDDLVQILAEDPSAGDVMAGTGGCRKLRMAGRGKGKSGGFRIVTFFTGSDLPVFLLAAFGMGDRANLTKAERNDLAKLTETLAANYRAKVAHKGAGR